MLNINIVLPICYILYVTSGFKLCASIRLILPFHSDWTTPVKLCKIENRRNSRNHLQPLSHISSFTFSVSSYPSFFIILSSALLLYPESSIMEELRTEKATNDPSIAAMNSHIAYISKSFNNHSVPNLDLTT